LAVEFCEFGDQALGFVVAGDEQVPLNLNKELFTDVSQGERREADLAARHEQEAIQFP
jgi:hypothetical protein